MSRWVELYTTSNSGKTLFVCKYCGRISPTPDKECSRLPEVVAWKAALPCIILEEIEAALIAVGEQEFIPGVALQIALSPDGKTGRVSWSEPSVMARAINLNIEKE